MSSALRAGPLLAAAFAVVAATTCSCPPEADEPSAPATGEPAPAEPAPAEPAPAEPAPGAAAASIVDPSHPLYGRVEGTSFANDCETAADCHVGGCSNEICSAEAGVSSTCEARPWPSAGASCGCVGGQCVWHRAEELTGGSASEAPEDGSSGAPEDGAPEDDRGDGSSGAPPAGLPGASDAGLPGQGEACPDGRCAGALRCLRYYGIAGARGPELRSCEIPCAKGGACPEGQRCVILADGPGEVCRAAP